MTKRSDRLEGTFTDAQAKEILRRAAELDAAITTRFTAAELQRIGAEASIDASAIDLAIGEARAEIVSPTAAASSKSGLLRNGLASMGLLAIGAGFGALAVTADAMSLGPESAAAVFGPSAAFALYRALRHRWHGSLIGFLQEVALIFGSFTLTATALESFHATTPALLWSLVCAAAGSAIVVVHLRPRMSVGSSLISDADERHNI